MKKITNFWLLLIFIIILPSSCKREIEVTQYEKASKAKTGVQAMSTSSGWVEDQDNGAAYDSLPRPTTLGYRLVNSPYSVANMQQASLNLYGTTSGITENKWYVRFKPANPQQLGYLLRYPVDT